MKKLVLLITVISLTFMICTSCGNNQIEAQEKKYIEEAEKMNFILTSPDFKNSEMIPSQFTCDKEDISPELNWTGTPEGTKSFVLICDDPDAPMGTWDHWVAYNIPADWKTMPKDANNNQKYKNNITEGKNSWGNLGYGGPCPPGNNPHRYFFKLYALDKDLNLKEGLDKKQLLKKIDGHIIAIAELMGKYTRIK